jgi:hypothetical protein
VGGGRAQVLYVVMSKILLFKIQLPASSHNSNHFNFVLRCRCQDLQALLAKRVQTSKMQKICSPFTACRSICWQVLSRQLMTPYLPYTPSVKYRHLCIFEYFLSDVPGIKSRWVFVKSDGIFLSGIFTKYHAHGATISKSVCSK